MPISQAVLDLWQSLSSSALMLGTLSIPFLLLSASSLITISTFLCKILRLLMSFCAVLLQRAKKKLSKKQQPHPRQERRLQRLEQELEALRAEFKSSEVKDDEQKRIFTIQR